MFLFWIHLFAGSQEFLVSGMEEAVAAVEETSIKRLVVGPLNIRLHSSAVHRILKMITCAMDHEYVSYCRPQPGQWLDQLLGQLVLQDQHYVLCTFEKTLGTEITFDKVTQQIKGSNFSPHLHQRSKVIAMHYKKKKV